MTSASLYQERFKDSILRGQFRAREDGKDAKNLSTKVSQKARYSEQRAQQKLEKQLERTESAQIYHIHALVSVRADVSEPLYQAIQSPAIYTLPKDLYHLLLDLMSGELPNISVENAKKFLNQVLLALQVHHPQLEYSEDKHRTSHWKLHLSYLPSCVTERVNRQWMERDLNA